MADPARTSTIAGTVMPLLSAGHKALTFFGWTPGLRRLVCGQLLDCGCLTGVYETKQAEIVTIIDYVAAHCTVFGHTVNLVVDAGTSPAVRTVADRNPSVNVVPLGRGISS